MGKVVERWRLPTDIPKAVQQHRTPGTLACLLSFFEFVNRTLPEPVLN